MTKVLILAYDFPPFVSVGALRPYSWYKYLNEFGIYPIVVTRQWNNRYGSNLDYIDKSVSNHTEIEETPQGKIIKSPFFPTIANKLMLKYGENKLVFLRKIISAFFEIAQFVLPVGPKKQIYLAAANYLKNNKVDLIIASGDPYILFKYASQLSYLHSTPWIADYRDIWSQNNYIKNSLFKSLNKYFEIKTTKNASAVITVSKFLEANISKLVKNKPFYILPNGFDPDAIEATKNIKQKSDVFRIAFIGSIYAWNPIEIFLSTLSKFVQQNKDVQLKLNFYGVNMYGFHFSLEELIEKKFPELSDYIHLHKKIPNDEVLKEIASQNLMLLFNLYAVMGTKIFDYIGLKRAILFCFENDVDANLINYKNTNIETIPGMPENLQAELIRANQAGHIIVDAHHLLVKLDELYKEFKKIGYIPCHTINSEMYSRKNQVKQLSKIIYSITKK